MGASFQSLKDGVTKSARMGAGLPFLPVDKL